MSSSAVLHRFHTHAIPNMGFSVRRSVTTIADIRTFSGRKKMSSHLKISSAYDFVEDKYWNLKRKRVNIDETVKARRLRCRQRLC